MKLVIMDYGSRYPDELLKSVDDSKEGRWVTVKDESSPLHGRHLFISGSGKILKGHGIPKHVVEKLNEKGGHNAVKHEPAQPHEMSMRDYRDLPENKGKHPDNVRVGWMHSMTQAVRKNGKDAIPKHVYEAEPWLEPYIDNGFKTPRKAPPKIAGEGHPFSKVQNDRNNDFLSTGNYLLNRGHGWGGGSGLSLEQKNFRDILHAEGYDAAYKYIDGRTTQTDKTAPELWNRMRNFMNEHKAKGEGLAPGEKKPDLEAPAEEPRGVKLYHATHQDNLKFGKLGDAKNYNGIGSWFTSDAKKAGELYGPNVHEAHVHMKNPYVVDAQHEDDFYDTFYDGELAKKVLTKQERDRWGDKEKTKLLNNGEYINKLKKMLVKSGYDGIVFKNSKIDLKADGSEGTHDVHVSFHPHEQVNNHKPPGGEAPAPKPAPKPKAPAKPKLADYNKPLKLKSNKADSILKAYGKHIYDHTVEDQGSYDFGEHPAHNLGDRKDAAYDHALDAIVNADDFEEKLKKTGKMSKSRELGDYDDDDLRERASQLLEEHMDSLEDTLKKSLDIHQGAHALVIPRKVAPVATVNSSPKN